MICEFGNKEWKKIVFDVRNEVVRHFPQIKQSLDFGAYIEPKDYFVSYIFETDKEFDMAIDNGLIDEVKNIIHHLWRKMAIQPKQ